MEVTLAGVWLRISAPPEAEFTGGVEGGRYSVSRLHTGATVGAMDTASWDAVGERTV